MSADEKSQLMIASADVITDATMETASEENGYTEASCAEGKVCQQNELDEIELKVELLWT